VASNEAGSLRADADDVGFERPETTRRFFADDQRYSAIPRTANNTTTAWASMRSASAPVRGVGLATSQAPIALFRTTLTDQEVSGC
jgi:hypothetical protein